MPDPIAHDLTFLFTDIEGSTQLLERLGPAYGIVLEKHRTLVARAIDSNGGRVVDTRGDEFFAAFPDAAGAVAAARSSSPTRSRPTAGRRPTSASTC